MLAGYFQRYEYFRGSREKIRAWFRLRPFTPLVEFQHDDVLVHLRRSLDMRILDRMMAINFYVAELHAMRPRRVYLCGTGLDAQALRAFEAFGTEVIDGAGIDVFRTMTLAPRMILGNSTYGWWGGYLSDAREIVFPRPLRGPFGPDRPEIDLEVDEPRYRYVDHVETEQWRPFAPVLHGHSKRVERPDGVLIESATGVSTVLKLTQPQLEFARWVLERREPFGNQELFSETGVTLRAALPFLRQLEQVSFIEIDPMLSGNRDGSGM